MCIDLVKDFKRQFSSQILSSISVALGTAVAALAFNLALFTFWLAPVLMAVSTGLIIYCALRVRRFFYSKFEDLFKCVQSTREECMPIVRRLKPNIVNLHSFLLSGSMLCVFATASAFFPAFGAVIISVAIVWIGVCLGYAITIVNLLNQLIDCLD